MSCYVHWHRRSRPFWVQAKLGVDLPQLDNAGPPDDGPPTGVGAMPEVPPCLPFLSCHPPIHPPCHPAMLPTPLSPCPLTFGPTPLSAPSGGGFLPGWRLHRGSQAVCHGPSKRGTPHPRFSIPLSATWPTCHYPCPSHLLNTLSQKVSEAPHMWTQAVLHMSKALLACLDSCHVGYAAWCNTALHARASTVSNAACSQATCHRRMREFDLAFAEASKHRARHRAQQGVGQDRAQHTS